MTERDGVDTCGFLCVHEDVVAQVQRNLPQEGQLLRLAELCVQLDDVVNLRQLVVLELLLDIFLNDFGIFSDKLNIQHSVTPLLYIVLVVF